MRSKVVVLPQAEDDLLDAYNHLAELSSKEKADEVLRELERTCGTLAKVPLRGHYPPELERVGITMYREIHLRQYRIIYEVRGREVHVHAILDGRRDMQHLLGRRLVR